MLNFRFGARFGPGMARSGRIGAFVMLAVSLSACSMFDTVSQMWQGDKYTTEITPDTPASIGVEAASSG